MIEKEEATAATVTPKEDLTTESYQGCRGESSLKRQAKIAERRAQIPRAYRATYDKAIAGRSLRAAVNAQCLECCMWQRKEITLCNDLACPLYVVRPYQPQEISQNGHHSRFSGAESKNSTQGAPE